MLPIVIPLRAEEDRDLESPTHTPPTAYIWCQRGGMLSGE